MLWAWLMVVEIVDVMASVVLDARVAKKSPQCANEFVKSDGFPFLPLPFPLVA